MGAVTVRVPAKVNLHLSVGARREDGYHDLVNVFHAVSLFDDVTVREAEGFSVARDGDEAAAMPADEDNLAVHAARALAREAGVESGVELHIRKAIPVAGGMAGGSADAAAALVACNELWNTGLGREELVEVAGGLGSDVPFALLGGTAVGLGRGERLSPALVRGSFHWVLAFAREQLSTAAVYAECDRLRKERGEEAPRLRVPRRLMAALAAGDAEALGAALANDLQPAALTLCARLRRTLTAGRENGALGAVVSGSGPTCAFLAGSERHALDLAVALSGAGVCRSVVRAYGPVPGAQVVPNPED
ncbi:MAG: 4-(cytidine 5'-diphospho)-2-C-methyl-D-erythritol kinase [Streptosporangiales bacterium]|nr:4-(cytidine 5'-diphospho)-2-C-methyl-D-erythritol kinase [Streptosporangiales bacterium]